MSKKHNREIWAGPEAFEKVLNPNNKTQAVIIVAPKGTAKSETLYRYILQKIEKGILAEKPIKPILLLKNVASAHEESTYSALDDLINVFDLKGYMLNFGATTRTRHITKGNTRVMFLGFEEQERRITGWRIPLSMAWIDELLNSDDSNKDDVWKIDHADGMMKKFASIMRNIKDDGKFFITLNLHYMDYLIAPIIYNNFDPNEIRKEVKEKGYFFRILKNVDEVKGFPMNDNSGDEGVSILILDPKINQFYKGHSFNYKSEFTRQAMNESLPDENEINTFWHRKYTKSLDLRDDIGNIEFIGCSIDPASGKDNFNIMYWGWDDIKYKAVVIDSMSLNTKKIPKVELVKELDEFYKESSAMFWLLYAMKRQDIIKFVVDTDKQTESMRFIIRLMEDHKKLDEEDKYIDFRKINWTGDKYLSMADKNGIVNKFNGANLINRYLIDDKIAFIKNDGNLEAVKSLRAFQVIINSDGKSFNKVISHSDEYDCLKYGLQIFETTQYFKNKVNIKKGN